MTWFFTAEWLFGFWGPRNGGEIVFYRSLSTAFWIYCLALAILMGIDPDRSFDSVTLRSTIGDTISWFGAIFAAAYAALYARFSSQWNYLANLYNQLKEVQVTADAHPSKSDGMAAWWAAFIEDAEDLHLACKPMFASVIAHWGKQAEVRKMFCAHSVGGEKRLDRLLVCVEAAIAVARRERNG